jgi:hypothetical protein
MTPQSSECAPFPWEATVFEVFLQEMRMTLSDNLSWLIQDSQVLNDLQKILVEIAGPVGFLVNLASYGESQLVFKSLAPGFVDKRDVDHEIDDIDVFVLLVDLRTFLARSSPKSSWNVSSFFGMKR